MIDLVAIDREDGRLVAIELKPKPDPSAIDQALRYATYLEEQREDLVPFFRELAGVMARLYGGPEVELADDCRVVGLAAWPGHDGAFELTEVDPAGVPPAPDSVAVSEIGIGPQHRADPPFRARMRFHQSWWRAEVLGVRCGTGPTETSTSRYGNMLNEEDAAAGLNFLSPEIFEVAKRRIAAGHGVEPFRCLRNLLSSQPMCFNLLAPLVRDERLGARFVDALGLGASETARTHIEWAPAPRARYLDDRTAFDALIEWTNAKGKAGLLAIETKLTEPFSQAVTNPDRYIAVTQRFPDVFRADRVREIANPAWFQLVRNHLLALLVADARRPPAAAHVMVIGHPLDDELWAVVERHRELLVDDGPRLLAMPLDRAVGALRVAVEDSPNLTDWLDAFDQRYVDLAGSEGAIRT